MPARSFAVSSMPTVTETGGSKAPETITRESTLASQVAFDGERRVVMLVPYE